MTPLWRTLPTLLALLLGGGALLALAGVSSSRPRALRGAGPGAYVRAAGAGLAGLYALWLHPLGGALWLAALVLLARASLGGAARARAEATRDDEPSPWPFALLGLYALALALRPPVPLYWDEFVWLAKARLATERWDALRAAALDPSRALVPAGYPLLWSAGAAWLAGLREATAALVAGSAALRLLSCGLALEALRAAGLAPRGRGLRTPWVFAALAALSAPLLWVHAGAAHADLPVGALAAATALALFAALRASDGLAQRRGLALAVVCVALAAGFKDEGTVYALAALLGVLLARVREGAPPSLERARPAARAMLAVLFALAPAFALRVAMARAGVRGTDHALGAPTWSLAWPLAREALRLAADLRSWGLFPVFAGAALARGLRAREPLVRALAYTLALQGAGLAAGLLCGSDRVRAFALDGTLLPRLGVQLAPTAAVLLAASVDAWLAARAHEAPAAPSAATPAPAPAPAR